jgi:hypothetical protein
MSPELARLGPQAMSAVRSLSEGKPTGRGHRPKTEFDPQRTSRKKFHSCVTDASAAHGTSQLDCVLQELFQFLEEARQAGVLLQEDVVPPRQCHKARTRYSRRQFAPQFARN